MVLNFAQFSTPIRLSLSDDPIATSFYPTMSLVLRLINVVFNATKLLLSSLVKQLHDICIKIVLIALER